LITIGAALNLFWVFTTLVFGVRLYRHGQHVGGSSARKICALLLAAVSLFPVFSSTDDLVRFAFLGAAVHTGRTAGTPASDDESNQANDNTQLARLLDSLDSVQITSFFFVATVFAAFEIAPAVRVATTKVSVRSHFGRAPPLA
jgi:hypothetical protein